MQIQVTIESASAILHNKEFTVKQGNRVILRDKISGKISSTFSKRYELECDSSELSVQFSDGNDLAMHISASII